MKHRTTAIATMLTDELDHINNIPIQYYSKIFAEHTGLYDGMNISGFFKKIKAYNELF